MADWAALPEELLSLVVQHINQVKDFIIFGLVCKSWQSAKPPSPAQFPWLMLAEEDDSMEQPRCFFNLFTSKIYKCDLPEAHSRKCLGTGFGWLLTIGFDLTIKLLHPFSRNQICLSPQSTFTHQNSRLDIPDAIDLNLFVKKAALSSSPQDEDGNSCVVIVLYGTYSMPAYARVGSKDKLWVDVPVPSKCYDDVIYYKQQFYAVDCHGSVVVCDINNDDDPRATVVAMLPDGLKDQDRKYLVESSLGDLLLISRIYGRVEADDDEVSGGEYSEIEDTEDDSETEDDTEIEDVVEDDNNERLRYYTLDFVILKMEAADNDNEYPYKWVKVNNLGNTSLFVGNNSSVSFSSTSPSLKEDFKPNCIYFTDDNESLPLGTRGRGHDMGIFNIEDERWNLTIQAHPALNIVPHFGIFD